MKNLSKFYNKLHDFTYYDSKALFRKRLIILKLSQYHEKLVYIFI